MKKSLISAAILASLGSLTLSGCFSSSSSSTTAVSGTVVDWNVKDAAVCADANKNGYCDAGEASTTSGADGKFTLNVPNDVTSYNLLAKGGTDTATGKAFNGTMVASSSSSFITPLTTLEVNYGAGALERVNSFYGTSLTSLNLNPILDASMFRISQQLVTMTASIAEVASRVTNAGTVDGTAQEERYNYSLATNAFVNYLKADTTATNSTQNYVSETLKNVAGSLIGDTTSTAYNNLQSTLVQTSSTVYNAVNDVNAALASYTPPTDTATAPTIVVSAQTTAADAADAADDSLPATFTAVTITVPDDAVAVSGTSGSTSTAVSAVSGGTQ